MRDIKYLSSMGTKNKRQIERVYNIIYGDKEVYKDTNGVRI